MVEEKQYVVFSLAGEEYGIDIVTVQEIIVPTKLTKLPNMPPYFLGVFNLRGSVIPLMDLKKRFNIEAKETSGDNRIIVVKLDRSVGILVDSISEVLRISSKDIELCQDISAGIDKEFITGVAKVEDRLIILLQLTAAI